MGDEVTAEELAQRIHDWLATEQDVAHVTVGATESAQGNEIDVEFDDGAELIIVVEDV